MEGKKLKILMTTDTVGGVWNFSLELCRALKAHETEIHLMSLGQLPSSSQIEEVSAVSNIIFYPRGYKLEWMENSKKDVERTEKEIYRFYKLLQPDIIHFNNYVKSERIWDIPKVTVYHSCVQTWWKSVKGCKAPIEWSEYLDHIEDSLNASDIVIFPTVALRDSAFAVHRIGTETEVIHNGRKTAATGNEPKEKIILCMGRVWDEAKNISLLLSLADQLPWPIYVAGANSVQNSNENISLDKIRFLGILDSKELNYWLERTEIYINPALYEPFGLAVLEAAKAGCALAISDLDTLREVWKENALYFDPRDKEQIIERLLALINDESLRAEYQKKAKLHATKYSLEVLGDSYEIIYRTLLKKMEARENKKMVV